LAPSSRPPFAPHGAGAGIAVAAVQQLSRAGEEAGGEDIVRDRMAAKACGWHWAG